MPSYFASPSVARSRPGEWPEHSDKAQTGARPQAGDGLGFVRCEGGGDRFSSHTPPCRGEAAAERRRSFSGQGGRPVLTPYRGLLHCDAVAAGFLFFEPKLARIDHPLTPSP